MRRSRASSLWDSESSKDEALKSALRLPGFIWVDDFDLTPCLRDLCGAEDVDENGFMFFSDAGIKKFLRYLFDAGIDICAEIPGMASVHSKEFYVRVYQNFVKERVISEEGSVLIPHTFGKLQAVTVEDIQAIMERYAGARSAFTVTHPDGPTLALPDSHTISRLYKLLDAYLHVRKEAPRVGQPPETQVETQIETQAETQTETQTEPQDISIHREHAKLEKEIERLEEERKYYAAVVDTRKYKLARAEEKLARKTEERDQVEDQIRQLLGLSSASDRMLD